MPIFPGEKTDDLQEIVYENQKTMQEEEEAKSEREREG